MMVKNWCSLILLLIILAVSIWGRLTQFEIKQFKSLKIIALCPFVMLGYVLECVLVRVFSKNMVTEVIKASFFFLVILRNKQFEKIPCSTKFDQNFFFSWVARSIIFFWNFEFQNLFQMGQFYMLSTPCIQCSHPFHQKKSPWPLKVTIKVKNVKNSTF